MVWNVWVLAFGWSLGAFSGVLSYDGFRRLGTWRSGAKRVSVTNRVSIIIVFFRSSVCRKANLIKWRCLLYRETARCVS
jgi:hypothetical protein